MTDSSTRVPGVHYGEQWEKYSADWKEAVGDALWAVSEGYLDDHLADLVKAAIARREHLAKHGAVPALRMVTTTAPEAPAATTQTPVKQDDGSVAMAAAKKHLFATGWDEAKIDEHVNRHAGSIPWLSFKTSATIEVGTGKYLAKRHMFGKVVRLQRTKSLNGVAAEIVKVDRSRIQVKLLEMPFGAPADLVNAFLTGQPVVVSAAAASTLAKNA